MLKKKIPFDYFSLPVQSFNIKGQDSSKTWLGFLFTLALITLVTAVFITGLIGMFQRQSLNVSISEEGLPTPPPVNIRNLTMAFAVTDRLVPLKSLIYGVDYILKAQVRTFTFSDQTAQKLDYQTEYLLTQECDEAYFGDLASEFNKVGNFKDMRCISRDQISEASLTLQGQLGSTVYRDIYVIIECGNNGPSVCPWVAWSVPSTNVILYYALSYLDSSNFEKPVTQIPAGITDHADVASLHEKQIWITEREIITDAGFVFSSTESQTDLMISDGQTVVEAAPGAPTVFLFSIKLATKKIIVKREYKKILDVLATTTGIASTVAFVVAIVMKPYVELKAYNDIMKTLFPEKHTEMRWKDYVRAVVGDKAAREKMRKVREDKEWITRNLDLIKLIKNWSDLEKMKKVVVQEESVALKDFGEGNSSFSMEKKLVMDNSMIENIQA